MQQVVLFLTQELLANRGDGFWKTPWLAETRPYGILSVRGNAVGVGTRRDATCTPHDRGVTSDAGPIGHTPRKHRRRQSVEAHQTGAVSSQRCTCLTVLLNTLHDGVTANRTPKNLPSSSEPQQLRAYPRNTQLLKSPASLRSSPMALLPTKWDTSLRRRINRANYTNLSIDVPQVSQPPLPKLYRPTTQPPPPPSWMTPVPCFYICPGYALKGEPCGAEPPKRSAFAPKQNYQLYLETDSRRASGLNTRPGTRLKSPLQHIFILYEKPFVFSAL
jgi:hypothetical protein